MEVPRKVLPENTSGCKSWKEISPFVRHSLSSDSFNVERPGQRPDRVLCSCTGPALDGSTTHRAWSYRGLPGSATAVISAQQ